MSDLAAAENRTLVQVTIEWSDGSTEYVQGIDAERWRLASDMQAAFCYAHGVLFPDLNWQTTAPQDGDQK